MQTSAVDTAARIHRERTRPAAEVTRRRYGSQPTIRLATDDAAVPGNCDSSVTGETCVAINLAYIVFLLVGLGVFVFRRTSAAACAVAVAGSALVGLTAGVANAAPGCPDVHWMGAAGSGERDGYEASADGGMGEIVYDSYLALQKQLAQEGRTITAEAVDYPAKDVPDDAGVGDWLNYMGSVDG